MADSFDWNKFDTAPEIPPSELESFGRGAANGVTFGFAPAIAGAIGGSKDYLSQMLDSPEKLKDFIDYYRSQRDQYKAGDIAANKENPKSYLGGEVLGSAAPMLVPGVGELGLLGKGAQAVKAGESAMTAAKAAELLAATKAARTGNLAADALAGSKALAAAKAVQPAKSVAAVAPEAANSALSKLAGLGGDVAKNAGLGAVSSLGNSNADLTKGEYQRALDDMQKGARNTAVIGGAGKALAFKANALGGFLDKLPGLGGLGSIAHGGGMVAGKLPPVALKNIGELPETNPAKGPIVSEDAAKKMYVDANGGR